MNNTILLVEDSADDVFFMRRAFQLAGMAVSLKVAEDGAQAIEYLSGAGAFNDRSQNPLPAAVLLDLRLPRVPGFDVLKWIRSQTSLDWIPVLVLTSSREERDMQKAYELGANSFLTKPSDANELTAMVKSLAEYWIGFNTVPDRLRG
jgi:DNA-binding response OmpR family regulator